MAPFLSPDWVSELDEAVSTSAALRDAAQGCHLVLQQVVSDTPQGRAAYYLEVDDGWAGARTGESAHPDVRIRTDYQTAVSISLGRDSAQAAFMRGRLQVDGDMSALLRSSELLAALDDLFAGVRSRTSY